MRSWGTRSTKLHGPTQTGAVPNFSPSLFAWAGDTGMPARSASVATSGANGAFSLSRTVRGSTTSMAVMRSISLRRLEPFMCRWRSRENRTASAFIGVPSLNLTPGRSLIVTVLPPSEKAGSSAASCGKILRPSSMS